MLTDLNPQLSVIIPVSDDPDIVDCVKSLVLPIELRVELIIILNGATKVYTKNVKKKLESYNYVRIIEMDRVQYSWCQESRCAKCVSY